jgi:hypothetical protein
MRDNKRTLAGAFGSIFSAVGSLAEAVETSASAVSTAAVIADNLAMAGVHHSEGFRDTAKLEAAANTERRMRELKAELSDLGIDIPDI